LAVATLLTEIDPPAARAAIPALRALANSEPVQGKGIATFREAQSRIAQAKSLLRKLEGKGGEREAWRGNGPSPNRPDEPLAEKMLLAGSAEFLDSAVMAWTKARNCASCHTSYPYLMARPLLGDDAPALTRMRKFFEDRVANWDKGEKGAGLPEG